LKIGQINGKNYYVMFLKLLLAFVAAVIVTAVAILYAWNYVIVQLPIEGIIFKPLTLNQAVNIAFAISVLEITGIILAGMFKKILK